MIVTPALWRVWKKGRDLEEKCQEEMWEKSKQKVKGKKSKRGIFSLRSQRLRRPQLKEELDRRRRSDWNSFGKGKNPFRGSTSVEADTRRQSEPR